MTRAKELLNLLDDNEAVHRQPFRTKMQGSRPDTSKSRSSKGVWKRYRKKIERGQKKFHQSAAGRRQHRQLGDFNKRNNYSESIHLSADVFFQWISDVVKTKAKEGNIPFNTNGIMWRGEFLDWGKVSNKGINPGVAGAIAFILAYEELDSYLALRIHFDKEQDPYLEDGSVNTKYVTRFLVVDYTNDDSILFSSTSHPEPSYSYSLDIPEDVIMDSSVIGSLYIDEEDIEKGNELINVSKKGM